MGTGCGVAQIPCPRPGPVLVHFAPKVKTSRGWRVRRPAGRVPAAENGRGHTVS